MTIEWTLEHVDDLLIAWAALVTIASVIVKLTPSRTDDELLARARRLFEGLALNAKPTELPK